MNAKPPPPQLPSYLLRIPDAEGRKRQRAKFEADPAQVRDIIAELEKSGSRRGTA